MPFAGINVILIGDFHQLDPIGSRALYLRDTEVGNEAWLSEENRSGHVLYTQFRHTVLLTQQVRVTDPGWLGFLRNIRKGTVSDADVEMLSGMVVSVSSFWNT